MKSKLQLKLIYLLTCLALLPILLLSGFYIYQSRENAVEEKIKKLHALAKSKQATLETHLESQIKALTGIAQNSKLISFLDKGTDFEDANEIVKHYQENMWGASHHVFVADSEGNIVLSPYHEKNQKSTHLNHSISTSKYFKDALYSTQVTDFFGFEETTHYHQLVMVPIKNGDKTLGVIISEITIQYYIDLLAREFELGKTGTVYLSTLNYEKVVHLKKSKIKNIKNNLIEIAMNKGQSYGEQKVNEAKTLLASYNKSKKYPWILAVEIDKSEVVGPINEMTKKISFIYIILIAIFLIVFSGIIKMIKKPIQAVLDKLESKGNALKQSSSDIYSGSQKLSQSVSTQVTSLEQTVSALDEINAMTQRNAESSKNTKEVSQKSNNVAREGLKKIDTMVDSMAAISESNNEIDTIAKAISQISNKTKVINDIVFQTKLLSINASVEAAKAGEYGKGFAVVAEEIGNLAEISGKASIEINELISNSIEKVTDVVNDTKEKVDNGKLATEEAGQVLRELTDNVAKVDNLISEIATASFEQSTGIQEVSKAIRNLEKATNESSIVAKRSLITSESIRTYSMELEEIMDYLNNLMGKRKKEKKTTQSDNFDNYLDTAA